MHFYVTSQRFNIRDWDSHASGINNKTTDEMWFFSNAVETTDRHHLKSLVIVTHRYGERIQNVHDATKRRWERKWKRETRFVAIKYVSRRLSEIG